jgi:hypothetical protein
MGKGNPSSVGYARGTMVSTQQNAREYFGGNSKAGIPSRVGLNQWTNGAIVNGTSGHGAPPFAGNSFVAAWKAGLMPSPIYPVNMTNQLGGIGRGTTGGMTRTPADGVNALERTKMQLSVNAWNQAWPAMPIRGTPNASRSIPFSYYNPGEKFNPVKNRTLVNASNQKAQINVSPPVTVAIPDAGGGGISNVVGNGPGLPGTITVGNAITQSFNTAP